jgi:predicted transcriptional regulator
MAELVKNQIAILKALDKMSSPVGGKEIAEASGVDATEVNNHITKLKKLGFVDSPVRCKYCITDIGKKEIK